MSYLGASSNKIRDGGNSGHVRVSLSSNVGQGNGGTALACAGCYVQAAIGNTEVVRWNLGVAASGTVGQDLARPHINDGTDEYGAAAAQPLWIPISDVADLYFYSDDADAIVDIIYLKG